jgi:hypothetical protein
LFFVIHGLKAVAIELWQWVTWVGTRFKIVVKDYR